MRVPVVRCAIAGAIALLACSRSSAAPPAAPAGDDAGAQGCKPGELTLDDGTCQPAGIPPEMCGAGFKSDGNMGCDPVLPPQPCPKGQMAVPGETQCHEVAPCADGNWGDIPVEASTQFVDAAYAGGASDGTQGKPWTTIGDAVKAAAPSAIVAIAAGSYPEDVTILGQPVRLWGRCPRLVEIVGTGAQVGAIHIRSQAAGTEIRDMAVSGAAIGIALSGSKGVVVDRAWIHDTGWRGTNVEDTFGPTSVTVSRSLIEGTQGAAVVVGGAGATIESSVLRDAQSRNQEPGSGMAVGDHPQTHSRATLALRGSVIERNRAPGVFIHGSDATIEDSIVRDQRLTRGIEVDDDQATRARASLVLRTSVVERNRDVGVAVFGSDATIERTVVRDTLPSSQQVAYGVSVHADLTGGATAAIRSCLVEANSLAGIVVRGSGATIAATVVRDTQPQTGDHAGGDGINVDGADATAEITASRVENSARAGVSSFGAHVSIASTAFDCNAIDINGETSDTGSDYQYDLSGGSNVCGCAGGIVACQVLSSGLAAPAPIKPSQ